MSVPTRDEILFAAGGDVWTKYGTFVRRTLPAEERGTFSRSSDATYTDRSGNLRTAESGVLRPHYVSSESSYSGRLEAARTNELHNSDSPATQTRNLTAGTYTLWMEGSGSVDASGATDGSYGTATEGQSNDLTFTVSAQQDVTFTVNNTVTRFQCEEGSFRSSFIATAGSAVSRAADDLSFPISFGPQELTVYTKFVERGGRFDSGVQAVVDLGNQEAVPGLLIWSGNSEEYKAQWKPDSGTTVNATVLSSGGEVSIGDVVELRTVLYANGDVRLEASVEGGATTEESGRAGSGVGLTASWNTDKVYIGQRGDGTGHYGHDAISGPIIAPGVRTMDEMRSVEV